MTVVKLLPLVLALFAPAILAQPAATRCGEIRVDIDRAACRAALLEASDLPADRRAQIAAWRHASDDPETFAALRGYAEILVGESQWPIVFDGFLIITSSPGGIELVFELESRPPGGAVPPLRAGAFDSLTRAERRARWLAAFCRPEMEALIERYGLFSATAAGVSAASVQCFPPDELMLIEQLGWSRRRLYQWQWDLGKFLDGERAELPVEEYRQIAERAGLRTVWPLIESESEFESRFREWLETQVLSPK